MINRLVHDIEINPNEKEKLTLFDTHKIAINRGSGNNVELVIHQNRIGSVKVRFAKEPYWCKIFLANGTEREVDLGDENDWGNIQQMTPTDYFKEGEMNAPKDWADRIGWGSDADGHIEIVRVELLDGVPHGTDVPLEDFKQDVHDFLIYHEN